MKLSDYLVLELKKMGVKHIFMIVGGGAMHLNDSVGKDPDIKYICNHHEQASAIAAECYARLKNEIGVCLVTTGPGGTNTFTGLIGAWLDSIPMLFISGQVKKEISLYQTPGLRQVGIQEINIIDMVKPVTKYAAAVLNAQDIKYHLQKAVHLATTGRPGPVWLDIPLDIQGAMIDENNLKSFSADEVEKNYDFNLLEQQVNKVLNLINKAKRPVIVAGFGIRLGNAVEKFYKLTNLLKIPIVTSLSAHDLLWEDHPLQAGRFGLYGDRGGNFTVQNSDLILVLGCRLNLWETGYDYKNFAREAQKIVVDIDKTEYQKPTVKPDLLINSDVSDFFDKMLVQMSSKKKISPHSDWLNRTLQWHKRYPNILPEYERQKKYVNSYYFTGVLSELLKENEIIVTGNGSAFTCTAQSIKIKKGQRLCINIGCASMGYDLPAAIGAYFASGKRIVLITGDGSIQMNLQEFQTIVHHKIPVKIFLLNNDGYLSIKITQNNFFKRFAGIDKEHGVSFPDMLKIAKAYGIPSLRIKNQKGLKGKIKKVLESKGPIICEVMMDPNQPLLPKPTTIVRSDGSLVSTPLEDMYPFLPREEFLSNMIIKPLNT